jgi:hypothetical protein
MVHPLEGVFYDCGSSLLVDSQSPVGYFYLNETVATTSFFNFSMISIKGLNACATIAILGDGFRIYRFFDDGFASGSGVYCGCQISFNHHGQCASTK